MAGSTFSLDECSRSQSSSSIDSYNLNIDSLQHNKNSLSSYFHYSRTDSDGPRRTGTGICVTTQTSQSLPPESKSDCPLFRRQENVSTEPPNHYDSHKRNKNDSSMLPLLQNSTSIPTSHQDFHAFSVSSPLDLSDSKKDLTDLNKTGLLVEDPGYALNTDFQRFDNQLQIDKEYQFNMMLQNDRRHSLGSAFFRRFSSLSRSSSFNSGTSLNGISYSALQRDVDDDNSIDGSVVNIEQENERRFISTSTEMKNNRESSTQKSMSEGHTLDHSTVSCNHDSSDKRLDMYSKTNLSVLENLQKGLTSTQSPLESTNSDTNNILSDRLEEMNQRRSSRVSFVGLQPNDIVGLNQRKFSWLRSSSSSLAEVLDLFKENAEQDDLLENQDEEEEEDVEKDVEDNFSSNKWNHRNENFIAASMNMNPSFLNLTAQDDEYRASRSIDFSNHRNEISHPAERYPIEFVKIYYEGLQRLMRLMDLTEQSRQCLQHFESGDIISTRNDTDRKKRRINEDLW